MSTTKTKTNRIAVLTTSKGGQYTIPEKNLVAFVLYQAMTWGYDKPIKTVKQAVKFLNVKGVKVEFEEKPEVVGAVCGEAVCG